MGPGALRRRVRRGRRRCHAPPPAQRRGGNGRGPAAPRARTLPTRRGRGRGARGSTPAGARPCPSFPLADFKIRLSAALISWPLPARNQTENYNESRGLPARRPIWGRAAGSGAPREATGSRRGLRAPHSQRGGGFRGDGTRGPRTHQENVSIKWGRGEPAPPGPARWAHVRVRGSRAPGFPEASQALRGAFRANACALGPWGSRAGDASPRSRSVFMVPTPPPPEKLKGPDASFSPIWGPHTVEGCLGDAPGALSSAPPAG